jgi:glycine/D-amino acid oxidase-like deaminating enzyme
MIMISSVHPAFLETELPARADVVVVGGGIIGVSAALHLAKKGVSVTLCEKGRIAGEQSSRNWGWCRTMGRDPAEIPLSIESLRMWAGMNLEVGGDGLPEQRHHLSLREPKGS